MNVCDASKTPTTTARRSFISTILPVLKGSPGHICMKPARSTMMASGRCKSDSWPTIMVTGAPAKEASSMPIRMLFW